MTVMPLCAHILNYLERARTLRRRTSETANPSFGGRHETLGVEIRVVNTVVLVIVVVIVVLVVVVSGSPPTPFRVGVREHFL